MGMQKSQRQDATESGSRGFGSIVLLVSLWLLVIASAIGVVYSTYLSRQLFNELESLKREENELQVQWGQLLLEQSTWSGQVRVERLAKKKLNMHSPDPAAITMVKP